MPKKKKHLTRKKTTAGALGTSAIPFLLKKKTKSGS